MYCICIVTVTHEKNGRNTRGGNPVELQQSRGALEGALIWPWIKRYCFWCEAYGSRLLKQKCEISRHSPSTCTSFSHWPGPGILSSLASPSLLYFVAMATASLLRIRWIIAPASFCYLACIFHLITSVSLQTPGLHVSCLFPGFLSPGE